MNRKLFLSVVVLATIIAGPPCLANMGASSCSYTMQEGICDNPGVDESSPYSNSRQHVLSEEIRSGTLDPANIHQSGINIETTGKISARTDITPLVENNLILDSANGWMSDQVEVNVTNLQKLFVLNGTFADGIPGNNVDPNGGVPFHPLGWDADSANDEPGKQTLSASYYDALPRYVGVEAEGEDNGGGIYNYYKDSYIYWFQDIKHSPIETDFLLSFSFLYRNGPIGTTHRGDFEVRVEADDGTNNEVIWQLDPTTLPSRDVWNGIGATPVQLSGFASTFEIRLVLEIIESRTMDASNPDFDGNDDNAQYIRFWFDDISLVSETPPDVGATGLSVTLPLVGTTLISGTMGSGRVLVNYTYWETSPVSLSLSATTPVSFEYEARFVSVLRYIDSTTSTNPSAIGISFNVQAGSSPELQFYSYVPEHAKLEGFSMIVSFSDVYQNASVYDAFSVDVTSQVALLPGLIQIEAPVTNAIGWWRFTLDAPNHMEQLDTQVFNETLSDWLDNEIFHAGDRARAWISLGHGSSFPDSPLNIEIRWSMPNGTEWFFEAVDGDSNGDASSSAITFGPNNSTPGIWFTEVFWKNDTAVAFSQISFQVHHGTTLAPSQSIFEAEFGTNVTGSVTFWDGDTGGLLLDASANVAANWSNGPVTLAPNLAKGWWEADFDTSLVGTGIYTVLVNASFQFYENASCTFKIHVTSPAVLNLLAPSYSAINLGESFTAKVRYEFLDHTGVEDATIEVYSWTGPDGGLDWSGSLPVMGEPGNYTIELSFSMSGYYQITVRGIKTGVNDPITTFVLDVGPIATELNLLSGTGSAISITEQFSLTVQYLNATGHGLSGANVSIASIIPELGLIAGPTQYQGNGTYSILLTPTLTGTYTILITADLVNHQYRSRVFSLGVSPLPSILTLKSTTGSVAINRYYTLTLHFLDEELQGLANASVSVISMNPPAGVWISDANDLGNGSYTLLLNPVWRASYTLVLRVSLQNYQNGTAVFTLNARDAPTALSSSTGQSSAQILFSTSYELLLCYERTDITFNITGAEIEIIVGPQVTVTETLIGYRLVIQGDVLGTILLTIRASKPNYENKTFEFRLEISAIPTTIIGNGPPSQLSFDSVHDFILLYNSSLYGGVTGAEIALLQSGIPAEQISWSNLGIGYYSFSIHTIELGTVTLSFSISKYGYESQLVSYLMVVTPIQLAISPDSKLDETKIGMESSTLLLELRLIANDTGEPIPNASVTYSIDNTTVRGEFAESGGLYSARVPVPPEGLYRLVIEIRKENCTSITVRLALVSTVNIPLRATIAVTYSLPAIVLIAVIAGSRRWSAKRRRNRSHNLISLKKRFEDVKSIIGFLVIHKASGLPIYSRIMKEGFEEGLLSGFITAITNFGSELREDAKLWTAYPISEVVSAVETEKLICALITVASPSDSLIESLEEMGSALGMEFDSKDDILAQISQRVEDAVEYAKGIETLFFAFFDGPLSFTYSLPVGIRLPRRMKKIKDVFKEADTAQGLSPDEIIDRLVLSGVDDWKAYSIVLEAIESGRLQRSEDVSDL
ncbi:MAG: FixH family protein [Promethearchaeota archaeon]